MENLADDSTKISRESAYPSKSRMEQKSISYRFGSIFLSQIESWLTRNFSCGHLRFLCVISQLHPVTAADKPLHLFRAFLSA